MGFKFEYARTSQTELESLKVFKRRKVYDAIHAQLGNDPDSASRNRKCLGDKVTANFEYLPPLWELRVDDVRVFYEVDRKTLIIVIHAVRLKPPAKTTSQVLIEADDD